MRKLLNGIVEYQKTITPEGRERFAQLALGQKPDSLFFSCSDSRVVPNVFASTDPGDLFVVRSVGNLVPPSGPLGISIADESEASAVEFAVSKLKVRSIVVCGHSSCGAMDAVLNRFSNNDYPNLTRWLRHGYGALDAFNQGRAPDKSIAPADQLSQLNVLTQLENLRSYPIVRSGIEEQRLQLLGMWFDIAHAKVLMFDTVQGRFRELDEAWVSALAPSL